MDKKELFALSSDLRETVSYVNYQAECLRKEVYEGKTNSFSFLQDVIVTNQSDEDGRDLWLRFEVSPSSFLSIDPIHLSYLERRKKTVVSSFNVHLDASALFSLTEKRVGSIRILLEREEGEILSSLERPLLFLPIEESLSKERIDEVIASFVTPNDPLVTEVLKRALAIKRDKFSSSSFEGYSLHDPNKVLEDVLCIYSALKERGIHYSLAPSSFEASFSRIRLPSDVLKNGLATDLDFALLLASCLEAAALRPMLILYRNHVQTGVWLDTERSFYASKEENSQTVLNFASKGFGHLAIIESDCLREDMKSSFEESLEKGLDFLENGKGFEFALDVCMCRKERILPLPTPKTLADGSISFDFPSIKEKAEEMPYVDPESRRFLKEGTKGRKNRFDHWEDKLLDLNLRNRLISYKSGLRGIEILSFDAEKTMEYLENHCKTLLLPSPLPLGKEESVTKILRFPSSLLKEEVSEAYKKDTLLAVNGSDRAEDSLKSLSRKSRTILEESGCNPLFLTLGLIRWFDNEKAAEHGKGELYAPIFLLPVTMSYRKNGLAYSLEYSIDDLQLNRTVFEYFKQTFGLSFGRLNPLPRKEDGKVDVRLVYNEIRSILSPMKNWALLEENSALSLFNFAHFVMWNDLKSHRNKMMNHPIVASFVYGEKKWNAPENLVSAEEMDEKVEPKDFAAPLPADSSQVKVIVDAEKGESFILDGPPGTGKSQTIANMIVNFLYHGKKVLFVAEKEVALDVVKRRLDNLHLGQFVLKLASLGTPKSEILSSYSRLLELGPLSEEEAFEELGANLFTERKKLNDILRSLHDKAPYLMSPYDAIVIYLSKKDFLSKPMFPFSYVESLSLYDYRKKIEEFEEASRLSSSFKDYSHSPFLPFQSRTYSLPYRQRIEGELLPLKELADKLRLATYNAFFKGGLSVESRKNVHLYLEILSRLQSSVPSWRDYVLDESFLSKEKELLSTFAIKKEELALKETLSKTFNENVWILSDVSSLLKEAKEAKALPFFKRKKAFRSLYSRLSSFFLVPKKPKEDAFISLLEDLNRHQEKAKAFEGEDAYAKYIFGRLSITSSDEAAKKENELENTLYIARALQGMDLGKEPEAFVSYLYEMGDGALFGKANETLRSLYSAFEEKEASLKREFDFDLSLYGDTSDYFAYLAQKLFDAKNSLGRLGDWTHFLQKIDEAFDTVPNTFLDAFENGEINAKTLADSYSADVCFALLSRVLSERGLASLTYEQTLGAIESYRKDITSFQNSSIVETASRISSAFPKGADSFASSTSAYRLSKLSKNGGRGASLRFIFHEFRDLISTLTPCFMVSPSSLAQYLDPNDYHFDVVIFDEASQIPTSEAVGALYRADSFVIAGDEEQMPPSSYFVTSVADKDSEESLGSLDEDLESLLDDALVLRLPRKRLSWHYRSRHESLIAFSNNRFYGNSLRTFPSPNNENECVSFRLVKGDYERGRGINRPQAKAVVSEIVRRLKDPLLKKRSIGVVTFNESEQNLIEDLLEKELAKNPRLSDIAHGERIFVKNLENVQGDERDVILFDVTYGPDRQGNLSLNFGPLSLKRGERRLNVAISRAREEMIVFSSFEPEKIRAGAAKNEGASFLKDFLLFAKSGTSSLPNRLENETVENALSISSFLSEDLRKLGYVVKENFGASAFKIDLALASKEDPENYVLGILFDGPNDIKMSCRDRNVNEPNVLSSLSWHILRLYSVEYLDHPEEVIKKVVNAFNASLEGTKSEEEAAVVKEPLFVKKPKMLPKNYRPYEKSDYLPSDFASIDPSFVVNVVNAEYPISASLLDLRIREAYGYGRIGSRSREEINRVLRFLELAHRQCGSHLFYFPRGFDPDSYPFWRKSEPSLSKERRLVDISFVEISNCASDLLEEQGSMSIDDLAKQVSEAFGYAVLSKTSSDYLKQGIRASSDKRNGIHVDEDDLVSLR